MENRTLGIYNVLSRQIQLYLREIIPSKMNDNYPNYEDHYSEPVVEPKVVNYYNSLEIIRQVFNHKYENENTKDKHNYEFTRATIGLTPRFLLRSLNQQVLVESNSTEDQRPEKLIAVLDEICKDTLLTNDIRKLVSIHKILEGDIQKFRQKMKDLSEQMDMHSGE